MRFFLQSRWHSLCRCPKLGSLVFLLAWGGLVVGLPQEAMGQNTDGPCDSELEAAEDAYLNQRYEEAITLTSECVEKEETTDEAAIEAYRLMSLSFYRQGTLLHARSAISEILSIDSSYTADSVEDPPSYSFLVSTVRQDTSTALRSSSPQDSLLEPGALTEWNPASSQGAPQLDSRRPLPTRPVSLAEQDWLVSQRIFDLGTFGQLDLPPARAPSSTTTNEAVGINGLRFTYRNQHVEQVNGLNVSMWRPQPSPTQAPGGVNGLALGLPMTGGVHINGVALGIFGADGRETLSGVGIGGIGLAADRMYGLSVGGVGLAIRDRFAGVSLNGLFVGGSGSVQGISVSGLGYSVGGALSGIQAGGLLVGGGGNVQGTSVGGLTVFSRGGSVYGLQIGGLGVGAQKDIGGLTIGSLGAIGGEDVFGITLAGAFIRAGEAVQGIQATSAAITASQIQGLTAAGVVVGDEGAGVVAAPAYFYMGTEKSFTGLSISTFNHLRGEQRGLTIGLFNYAHTLQGVQLGLLNYAGNNPLALRLLPGINLNF